VRSLVSYTLGIAVAVHMTVALHTVSGQASTPNACALIDAAELKRLTGGKDVLGSGPEVSSPGQLPKNMSQCTYLSYTFALTTAMTPEQFARTRDQQAARTAKWKVQSVSGLGDEAYYLWDFRPGSYRSVGIVFRTAGQQMALGTMTSSDSVEAMKKTVLSVAKAVAGKMR
jgi:hypothetical protein